MHGGTWKESARVLTRVARAQDEDTSAVACYWIDNLEWFVSVKWSIRVRLIPLHRSALHDYRKNTFSCCIQLLSLYLNVQVQNTLQITCAFFCSSANVNNSLYYKRVVGNGVCHSVIRSRINWKEFVNRLAWDE